MGEIKLGANEVGNIYLGDIWIGGRVQNNLNLKSPQKINVCIVNSSDNDFKINVSPIGDITIKKGTAYSYGIYANYTVTCLSSGARYFGYNYTEYHEISTINVGTANSSIGTVLLDATGFGGSMKLFLYVY